MNKITARSLNVLITGVEDAGGKPDTVVVGCEARAKQAREALAELGRDFHVIEDHDLGLNSVWVVNSEDLAKFEGGGRN